MLGTGTKLILYYATKLKQTQCDFSLFFFLFFLLSFFLLLYHLSPLYRSVESLIHVWLFATSWAAHARPPCPTPTPRACSNSCPLTQWCHPTISSFIVPFSSCPQSFPASGSFQMTQLFASSGQSIGSFSFNIRPSNEHPGLISFRMDWMDLLAVQGTLKSLLQHHSSKAAILQCSNFFIVQLSHPYMTTGKTIALTKWTFAGKVMSLFFNMLSRLVIIFLPKSKHLLISWLQSRPLKHWSYLCFILSGKTNTKNCINNDIHLNCVCVCVFQVLFN